MTRTRTLALLLQTASAIMLASAVFMLAWSIARSVQPDWKQWVASALMSVIAILLFLFSRDFSDKRSVRGIPTSQNAASPAATASEAIARADQANAEIEKVSSEKVRRELSRSLTDLISEHQRRVFRVVVFGTGSAGKTSLVNALLGRQVGAVSPTMGTTQQGEFHTEVIDGIDGTLILTDTPGLSESGSAGENREQAAKKLAEESDLLLFVLDDDLIRYEANVLSTLASIGKRMIVVLNKVDLLTDSDRDAILAKLRKRLEGQVDSDDIVATAASPRLLPVKLVQPDGSVEVQYEQEPPELGELDQRIASIIDSEGDELKAANLLLQARRLERQAVETIAKEHHLRALAVVEKYQWITAAAVLASPNAAFNLAAGGANQFQMVTELAKTYGVELSQSESRSLVARMMASLLKLGLTDTAMTLVAGFFKSSLFGFAAAGSVQAVTAGYLTRVSGLAFAEYFTRGGSWGEGGIDATVLRQFETTSRTEFLQEFIKQGALKLANRIGLRTSTEMRPEDLAD